MKVSTYTWISVGWGVQLNKENMLINTARTTKTGVTLIKILLLMVIDRHNHNRHQVNIRTVSIGIHDESPGGVQEHYYTNK